MPETDPLAEAAHFHMCFLGPRDAAPDLLRSYVDACGALGLGPDPLTARLVEARADLASCEFAGRFLQSRQNALTHRAMVMMSLAEVRPETVDLFLNTRPARLSAWFALMAAPIVAAARLSKGAILLWWHGRGL